MNDSRMNYNLFIFKCTFFLICLFCTIISFIFYDASNPFLYVGISLLIELISYLFFSYKIRKKIISFSTIFVLILFIFQFGQVVILSFFPGLIKKYNLRIVLQYFNTTECIYGLRIMNIAFTMFLLGNIVICKKDSNSISKNLKNKYDNKKIIEYSKGIIALTFPVKIVLDLLLITKSFTQSFTIASRWIQQVPGFIRAYGNFSIIGIGLLIVSLKEYPKKQKMVTVGFVLYLLILMFSGWRSENVAYLLIIFFLYISNSKLPIKKSKYIIYLLFTYLILITLYTIVSVRYSNIRDFSAYYEMFTRCLFGDKNIILESLREYGNTGYTTLVVLLRWLPYHAPSFGISYIFGIFAIFPNITGIPGYLTTLSTYALDLQSNNVVLSEYINIGGSILGELFYNFGIIGGILSSFLLGIIVEKISFKVKTIFIYNDYYKLILYIPLMYSMIYWIRDVFSGNIRDIVWGFLFCWFLNKIKYNVKEE